MRVAFALLLAGFFCAFLWGGAEAELLDARLASPNQGFYGLDSQSVSGEKTYTISLLENASWLFAGVLAREGDVNLAVKNSSNDGFPGSGGSVVIENAQAGVYTVTVTGTGKYVVFWDYLPSLRIQDCSSAGGICTPNACNTYNSCSALPATCAAGYCCSATCTLVLPAGSEILPWGLGLGQLYIVQGMAGQKKTYIIRVSPGTTYARAYFQAYLPSSVFQATFRPPLGFKYYGYETYTGTVRYSSAMDIHLYQGVITPVRTDGLVPPGDYILEILWVGDGPILINTVYST